MATLSSIEEEVTVPLTHLVAPRKAGWPLYVAANKVQLLVLADAISAHDVATDETVVLHGRSALEQALAHESPYPPRELVIEYDSRREHLETVMDVVAAIKGGVEWQGDDEGEDLDEAAEE